MKTVPTCRTCKSPLRRQVEEAILKGETPSAVAAALPGAGVTADNVAAHFKNGHMPLVESALDFCADDAGSRGEVVEQAALALAGELSFARLVLGRAAARVVSGAEQPTIRDGLAAEALLAKYTTQESFDQQEWVSGMRTMLDILREMLTADDFAEFCRRVDRHHASQMKGPA